MRRDRPRQRTGPHPRFREPGGPPPHGPGAGTGGVPHSRPAAGLRTSGGLPEVDFDDRFLHYWHDPAGRLTMRANMLGQTVSYTRDPLGRVLTKNADGDETRYAYDPSGRLLSATTPEAGRVTERRRTRLSRKPDIWRYTWDAEDRLTSCTTPDGTVWTYRYDPLGRRAAKQRLDTDGLVTEETVFTWDGTQLIEQTTTATRDLPAVALTWDYQGLTPLTQTERALDATTREAVDTRFFAITTDLVGTPTELITPNGHLAWRTRTTLWGTTATARGSTAHTPLRHPGQYADPETGLHYNLNRHYDPHTARYTSPDPLGLAPHPNPVAWVHNPHTWADPLGLAKCTPERALKASAKVIDQAADGRIRRAGNYHPHFKDERVMEILKEPDAVYLSQGNRGNLIFRQGEDIMVTKGPGAGAGDVITGYGPSGAKGDSGAAATGGNPTDPGPPVTHEDIVDGNVPGARGGTMAPATQIR